MPRIMFQEVVCRRRSTRRKWYTVPLSLAAHICLFAIVVIIPLIATDSSLPVPARSMLPYVAANVAPSPPPAGDDRRPSPSSMPSAGRNAAPIEAPDEVTMESGIVTEPTAMGIGNLDGLFDERGTGVVSIEQPPPIAPAHSEPIRPGGEIRPPVRIRNVVPVYPILAKRSKVQGVVMIEAIIGADGKVDNARVIRSIPLLDDAALEAVRSWEYTPTLLNGKPTPVIMTVTVQFTLN